MTLPRFPTQEPYPASGRPGPRDQPGIIPLRPLTVGEVLTAAIQVVRRHLPQLGGLALIIATTSGAAAVLVLAAGGNLADYASAGWLEQVLTGRSTSIPWSYVLATLLSLMISVTGSVVLAGVAAAYAGAQALGRPGRGAVAERLAGHWPTLVGVAVVVGVPVTLGLAVFVAPGVLIFLVLAFAAPVAVMERAKLRSALRRSALLTRGHRGRILGAVAAALAITVAVDMVLSALALSLYNPQDAVNSLLISQGAGVLAAVFTSPWLGAVVALLYIDVRMRTEGLAGALRQAAKTTGG